MANVFSYDGFLSHSAKDKAVVRPLAERLRKDGLNPWLSEILHSVFILLRFPSAPIKGAPAQFLCAHQLSADNVIATMEVTP
jgi:hypothetical protein